MRLTNFPTTKLFTLLALITIFLTGPGLCDPVVPSDQVKWRLSPDRLTKVRVLQVGESSSMSILRFETGAQVPIHMHEGSAEALYIISGHGRMEVDGKSYDVSAGDAVRIEAGQSHSFLATSPGEAVQVYSPSGPEQRFLKWPEVQEENEGAD